MIKQHTCLQERILAATILREDEELKMPGKLYIDSMRNEAETVYGSHPERLYIVLDGVVVYAGKPGPFGYHPAEVRAWLDAFCGKTT